MKKTAIVLAAVFFILSLTACGGFGGAETLSANAADYTIMVYMDGANLESDYGLATEDLKEMMSAGLTKDNVNVIVQTGGALKWATERIPNNAVMRYRIAGDTLQELEKLPQQSMVDHTTLRDFINYGYENYPAKRYGLVLWDHGSGPLFGYGMDQNFNNQSSMSISAIRSALESSAVASQPLEFIGFDSCLMATLEIAHALSPFAKYAVSSQELEPGQGWDYTAWLSQLSAASGVDGAALGTIITDSYMAFYNSNGMADSPLTLSVIDLSTTQAVVDALEGLVQKADISQADSPQSAQRARADTKSFGSSQNGGESHYDLVDLYDLAAHFTVTYAGESAALTAALDKAVLYNKKGSYVDKAGGLSIYFPYSELDYINEDLELYKSTGFSPVYINYISEFVKTLGSGKALVPMDNVVDQIPARGNVGRQNSGSYSVDISKSQINNLKNSSLHLYRALDDGSYLHVYKDMAVQFDNQSGKALFDFDGEVVTIGGQMACMYESEKGEGYTWYDVPAVLNGRQVDLQVLVDGASPEGRVVGAIPIEADSRTASRQMLSIKDGDMLAMVYSSPMLGEGHSEHMDHSAGEWVSAEAKPVNGALTVVKSALPSGTYLAGFCFCDLQGNSYDTGFIQLEF